MSDENEAASTNKSPISNNIADECIKENLNSTILTTPATKRSLASQSLNPTPDDIHQLDCQPTPHINDHDLPVSQPTLRLLKNMDENQVGEAFNALKKVKESRRRSRLSSLSRSSSTESAAPQLNPSRESFLIFSELNEIDSSKEDRFFKPVERENECDDEEEHSVDDEKEEIPKREQKRCSSLLVVSRIADQIKTEVENGEISPEIPNQNRIPPRPRKAGLSQSLVQPSGSMHKSLSALRPVSISPINDSNSNKNRFDNNQSFSEGDQSRVGGLWNRITQPLVGVASAAAAVAASSSSRSYNCKKKVDGATYFRRGKSKARKGMLLEAVALFNFALVQQREDLGQDHIDCATTLNEIGMVWMMLGERYPALTAFEEALYIRQQALGDGAMEVAETTNNIWMILHEQRCEMEKAMAEKEDIDT